MPKSIIRAQPITDEIHPNRTPAAEINVSTADARIHDIDRDTDASTRPVAILPIEVFRGLVDSIKRPCIHGLAGITTRL